LQPEVARDIREATVDRCGSRSSPMTGPRIIGRPAPCLRHSP
jgi:hypothetical protein